MARSLWIIAEDYGPEGLNEPFVAFLDKAEAEQCMELLGKPLAGTSARLIEVPIWMSEATRAILPIEEETEHDEPRDAVREIDGPDGWSDPDEGAR